MTDREQHPARLQASHYRWVICGLLFFATTFNYMDRQVISYLKEFFCTPAAQGGLWWSDTDFCQSHVGLHGFLRGNDDPCRMGHDKIGTERGPGHLAHRVVLSWESSMPLWAAWC